MGIDKKGQGIHYIIRQYKDLPASRRAISKHMPRDGVPQRSDAQLTRKRRRDEQEDCSKVSVHL